MEKTLQTVVAIGCMKTLLMVFNIAFWLSGVLILFSGIWMQVELHKYLELNEDFSKNAPYVLVAVGVVVLLVGVMACCCTVNGQPSLLYLYGGFLVVIFILEITLTASIYAYRDRLSNGFSRGLNKSMQSYGQDVIKTADFDIMQAKLECCGNQGYEDWDQLKQPLPVPRSCCIVNAKCDVEDRNAIYNRGCFDVVVNYIDSNMSMIGGLALIVTFFPILGILLSCCLAKNVNKAKYEPMN